MIFRRGETPQQSIDRAAARKRRRKSNAKFIAETQGIAVLLTHKAAVARLDHLTSLYVRRRDRGVHAGLCLVCKAKEKLGLLDRAAQPIGLAYHVFPRADMAIRFDLRNVIGACSMCNEGERWSRTRASLRDRYKQIHIEIVGWDVYEELEWRARTTVQFSVAELIAKCEELKLKMGERNEIERL